MHIDSLEVSDIQDTGSSWDSQDPSITLIIGKQTFHTKRLLDLFDPVVSLIYHAYALVCRQKDAKTEAKFPEEFSFGLHSADYNTQEVSTDLLKHLKSFIGKF